jgi:hypothetical protein
MENLLTGFQGKAGKGGQFPITGLIWYKRESVPEGNPMKHRVRFVSLLVLASALVGGCSTRSERERILKHDLMMMRQAIDNYTLSKEQAPQSLQDLVNGHLKEIPTDPFTRKKDWVLLFDRVSSEQSSTGIVDVHSASGQVGRNGRAYNEW